MVESLPVALLSLLASHHDVDLATLERLSAASAHLGPDVAAAVPGVPGVLGAVVLATCNRFEVYLDVEDAAGEPAGRVRAGVARLMAGPARDEPDRVAGRLRVRTGTDVARHLFTVAAGLDAMVVGEREIAGQVRRALTAARRDGTTTSDLEALFQAASRTSRAVEAATGLGSAGRSVVGVALDLVEPGLPAWPAVRCVLIGTGSYAGASLAAVRARGCADVAVWSGSGRADVFAAARGARAVADLTAALAEADLVIACSGAAGPVVDVAAVAGARVGTARPLAVVDLALRHDVDPAVAAMPGVRLVSLTTVAEQAPAGHSQAVERARAVVAAGAQAFVADRRLRQADPAVVELRQRARSALAAAVADAGLADAEDPVAARVVRALRRRLRTDLHAPTVAAREAARAGDAEALAAALAELAQVRIPAVPTRPAVPTAR